ncbi:MAG: DUF1926 domain-containing protein [Spirochaetaceae bacterium]|jgi:hypothetical protein|nr:DUF1926 domain-containing protein [Spirochaetaceae bacterium]
MSSDINIILGFNAHLSFASSDALFEQIYTKQLKPFFQIVYQFPEIPFTLHFSGSLLYKIDRIHSELSSLISTMIDRRQLELIGGGFYEPMMPLLSSQDRIGQIELLTTYLRKSFNKRVAASYIPDIAWEQSVTSALNGAGMLYTFLDEKRFIDAGLSRDEYKVPCIHEDKGKTIIVFPVFSSLRKELAKKNAAEVFDNLLTENKDEKPIYTIFPDFFPEDGITDIAREDYIRYFFETVSQFSNNINWTLPGKALKSFRPSHKVYFNDKASKQFLIEYPEAGLIYAKMVWTKSLIDQLKGDKERKHSAQEELWKAQGYTLFCYSGQYENYFNHDCNSGLIPQNNEKRFAEIQNAKVRSAAYSSMILAERTTREKGDWKASLISWDFDLDGINEYLFRDELMNCFVRPQGAALFELDFFPKTWNYLNTIQVSPLPERSFFDVIAGNEFNIRDTSSLYSLLRESDGGKSRLRICGNEFFECVDMDRMQEWALFKLPKNEGAFGAIEVEKDCKLNGNIFTMHYKLRNTGEFAEFQFITFIDFSFPDDSEKNLRIFAYNTYKSFSQNSKKNAIPNAEVYVSHVEAIDFQDLQNESIINISAESAFDAFIEPVFASYKNAAAEVLEQYQFTRLTALRPVSLEPEAIVEFTFKLGIFH